MKKETKFQVHKLVQFKDSSLRNGGQFAIICYGIVHQFFASKEKAFKYAERNGMLIAEEK